MQYSKGGVFKKLYYTPLYSLFSSIENYIYISCHNVRWFSQLNQSEFQDMDDEVRVQYEGFRPGMYVRVEVSPKIDVLFFS